MKILLTGADGFTGRHFARSAEAAGHAIVPLRSDLTRRDDLVAEVSTLDFDAVLHLGAIAFVAHDDERALYDVNLFGTLNLLDAIARRGLAVGKVVLASSANVYGNCECSPIAESQPPAPVNHYAMSKLAMEQMALARFPQLPLVIARPFNYTGPGQSQQFVIPKLVEHFHRRANAVALGNVHVQREYNDVRFVAEAYLRLLASGDPHRSYNICTGATHDISAVIGLLQELTGHPIHVEVDPSFVRPNEVHRLCGDPKRLLEAVGSIHAPELRETLAWMLEAAP